MFCASTGDRFHPKGGESKCAPSMRNILKAWSGILRDQKKFVRSIVVPHKTPGALLEIISAISRREGSLKVGGFGVSVFNPLKSAIKAAFSFDFGLTNADKFDLFSGALCGKGCKNFCRKRLVNSIFVK